jgi:hypothetical protein
MLEMSERDIENDNIISKAELEKMDKNYGKIFGHPFGIVLY